MHKLELSIHDWNQIMNRIRSQYSGNPRGLLRALGPRAWFQEHYSARLDYNPRTLQVEIEFADARLVTEFLLKYA